MFLPAQERCLTPQGIRMFALFYYAPWIGGLVPHRDRLGTMEVRYDPRDISHIYVRDPASGEFQPVGRRDGTATPMTLWEHEKARSDRRTANSRSDVEKVHIRRQIAAIAQTAKDKKTRLRHAARASRAADAPKPYEAILPAAPSPAEHPVRQKRLLPVEEW
jgi:putative transposase